MRLDGWQDRFWAAIDVARQSPFQWGEHDCVLFSAKMASAISDRDYVADTRAAFTWTSAAEALHLTRDGLQTLVESVLGPAQPWTILSQGDLVLIRDDEGRESVVVHDGCQLIGVAQYGIQPVPMRCALCGWRVD